MAEVVPVPAPVETVPMMAPDGAVHAVPVHQAAHAFHNLGLDFVKGTSVPVEVGGEARMHSAEEATAALERDITAKTVPSHVVRDQEEIKAFSGAGHTLAATGIGAANTLALGFGKELAIDLAEDLGPEGSKETTRRYLAGSERRHPFAEGVGDVGGFAVPLLASGGASLLAKAGARGLAAEGFGAAARVATAPIRGVAALGDAAAGAAERVAVAAGASPGGAVARVVGGAARGAAEMPIYEVGHAVSHAAVHDEPLTAEQLFAAGGHGLLLGGVFGGGLSVAGSLISGSGSLLSKAGEKTADLAEHLGFGRTTMGEIADRKAIQAVGASLGQVEKLGPPEGAFYKRAAQVVRDELPAAAGRPSLAGMSRKDMLEAVPAWHKKVTDVYDALFKPLDAAKLAGPDMAAVARQIVPMEAELAKSLAPASFEATLRELRERLEKLGQTTFDDAIGLRADVRRTRKGQIGEGTVNAYRKRVEDLIDAEIERAGSSHAGANGAEWAARYTKAKQDYAISKWLVNEKADGSAAKGALFKGAAREANNRSGGFSEQIGALPGMMALAMGHPLGLVLAGASAIGHNLVRRHGDQVVAAIAGKAVKSDLMSAIGETISEALGSHAAGFVNRSALRVKLPEAPGRGAWAAEAEEIGRRGKERDAKTAIRKYEEQRAALLSVTPAALVARTAGLADQPGLRSDVIAQADRARVYLLSKLPAQPPSMSPLQTETKQRPPAPADVQRFERYARAVDDPLSVVKDMARGRISREGVEALRVVYPRLYAQAQGAVRLALSTRKQPLTWEQQKQLAILLDIPTSPLMDPAVMRAVQGSYIPAPPTPTVPSGGEIKPFDIASQVGTQGQKLAAGQRT